MACSACAAHVEKKLQSLNGVQTASVNLATRSAWVEWDASCLSPADMKREINAIGYDLVVENNRSAEALERRALTLLRRRMLLAWVLSLLCMAVSMAWLPVGSSSAANRLALVLALACLWIAGRSFFLNARKQLRHGSANMDVLVALGAGTAFLFSVFTTFWGDVLGQEHGVAGHTYFDAAAMIVTFVLTGRWLEEKAKNETAAGIRKLMTLAPKTAHVVQNGRVEAVPLAAVAVGDVLEVRAGAKIPVDGEVTQAESFMTDGTAYVDESMMTGEPAPVGKTTGNKVLAGTLVAQGKLRLKALQIGEKTALAHIIRMVQEAQAAKAPVQRLADRVSLVFVPVVIVLAALTLAGWLLWGGMAMLPHAVVSAVAVLVIACPCALGLATPTALTASIGRAAGEQLLIKDATALEALRKVYAVVIDKTGTLTIPNPDIDFTRAENLPLEERETLKPHAAEAVALLKKKGIEVIMMSGDREEAAAYWAQKAGITRYKSQVKPADKENMVKQLQAEGHRVVMVGDGINDTQALALADVSIAMGRGTDVAMDVAQVTLLSDDLRAIVRGIDLSRKTVRIVGENIFWAFAYNLVCIPLATGVPRWFHLDWQITPMWAGALMAFSSISVVLNSLRLRRKN